jgi:hypothetical protein
MDIKSIFSLVAEYAGKIAVSSWAIYVATWYLWQYVGWAFLVTLNSFVMTVLMAALWTGGVAIIAAAMISLGLLIKGLFDKKK